MKRERDAANASTGRSLVVVKRAVVDEELAKLNMNFRRSRSAGRMIAKNAFEARQAAGRALPINPGVGADTSVRAMCRMNRTCPLLTASLLSPRPRHGFLPARHSPAAA